MALISTAYSPKQFQLAFKQETTIGTAASTSMMMLDVDSVEYPSLSPLQVFDVKQGNGRVLQTADAFIDEALQMREISFSGTADATSLPSLLKNITNAVERTAVTDTAPAAYVVPDSFQPTNLEVGAGSSTIINTCTVAVLAPESAGDIVFPGCRLTSLTISGDISTENGRIKMSGTFSTAMNPKTGQDATASAWASTRYSMSAWTSEAANFRIAGAPFPVMQSFSVNIENPAQYLGAYTVGGKVEPQAIAIGIPELACSYDASFKYDSNTDNLDAPFLAGTAVTTQLSDNTNWHASSDFGFYSKVGYITSLGFSEASAQMVDVSVKCAADASGSAPNDSLFEIIAD
tara:strand:- start:946 stop:1986 length:1041 start_codon:yes stop_codon:yes gene_type:complete